MFTVCDKITETPHTVKPKPHVAVNTATWTSPQNPVCKTLFEGSFLTDWKKRKRNDKSSETFSSQCDNRVVQKLPRNGPWGDTDLLICKFHQKHRFYTIHRTQWFAQFSPFQSKSPYLITTLFRDNASRHVEHYGCILVTLSLWGETAASAD